MTKEIQQALCKVEALKFNIPCENVKYLVSDWEFDVASLNKNRFLTEFEVKISRSDFKRDSKKRKFYFYNKLLHEFMPNRFYYVCPEGLIKPDEIPKYAGLMYYKSGEFAIIKKAPLIHKIKQNENDIMRKFLRVKSQRMYLGACRLTYENNLIKERNGRT